MTTFNFNTVDCCFFFFFNLRRPGILVLINDSDWELEGTLNAKLKDKDEVLFISTLHGG